MLLYRRTVAMELVNRFVWHKLKRTQLILLDDIASNVMSRNCLTSVSLL